jgi:thioredoxin-like negative regulator of GroEL
VLGDAETALGLAQANWSVQKEPRDARLLLESVIAANKPDAAQPVLEFLEKNRLEDSRLRSLTANIKGVRL